ncbi:MAG TPA: orotate phosphoribosyltransferase [Rhizobiales bacterium]|nr:orotate phosphoribosyltransferase [Hyphomicrobiales bacterium]
MTQDDVLNEFREAGALLEGHFILSSGLHSGQYLQCARVLMDAARAARLCAALKEKINSQVKGGFDIIASPAMGGVIAGYEMGRQYGVPSVFFERVNGELILRRGFEISPGAKVLMLEDIVTTGLSSRECIRAIADAGGVTTAAACLIDRSNGQADVGVPLISLARLHIPTYESNALPPELAGIPASKPGSRNLKA